MDYLLSLLDDLGPALRTAAVALGAIVILVAARRVLEKRFAHKPESGFRLQVILLGLTLAAFVVVVLALPISEATRAQLLSLFGIVLSAAIALSSTTLLGNIMAGGSRLGICPDQGRAAGFAPQATGVGGRDTVPAVPGHRGTGFPELRCGKNAG